MSQFALITGASSGIGKALAHCFAKDGYNLVIVADDETRLKEAAQELSRVRTEIQIVPIVKDLTVETAPQDILDELNSRKIAVEVLVNDAGVGQRGTFADTSLDKAIYIIRLNIEALTRLTKLFLPQMKERNSGGILNVGSIAGFQPGPLLAVYHASKAYVNSFSDALADELKDTGIKVTCLCPGATATRFFERADMENARIVKKGNLMDPADVAKSGYQAFKNGSRAYIPGFFNKALTFMRRLMPKSAQAKISKTFYQPAN